MNNSSLTQCQLPLYRLESLHGMVLNTRLKEMNVNSVKSYITLTVMDQGFIILRHETFIKSCVFWLAKFSIFYFSAD